MLGELIDLFREKFLLDVQTLELQKTQMAMSRVMSNIVDGLSEIQVNNMQTHQLARLDSVISEEITQKQGMATFANSIYRQISNRSVFDFASEVYIVGLVMKRRGINHETYRKLQNDIDYVTRLFGRIWNLGREAWRILGNKQISSNSSDSSDTSSCSSSSRSIMIVFVIVL